MHIHQRPVCCALPAGQSRGGWCAAPKPCVPARRETLLDVHSAPPWRSLNPPPVAMCRARVDWSYRQKTRRSSVHTFALRASLSCGYVQLPRLLWPCAEPSPAVTRHAGLSQGHQDTLRCTRLLSCGHVQVPRLLWPCEEPSLAGAQPSRLKSCRDKTRRPSGHTALNCAAGPVAMCTAKSGKRQEPSP